MALVKRPEEGRGERERERARARARKRERKVLMRLIAFKFKLVWSAVQQKPAVVGGKGTYYCGKERREGRREGERDFK